MICSLILGSFNHVIPSSPIQVYLFLGLTLGSLDFYTMRFHYSTFYTQVQILFQSIHSISYNIIQIQYNFIQISFPFINCSIHYKNIHVHTKIIIWHKITIFIFGKQLTFWSTNYIHLALIHHQNSCLPLISSLSSYMVHAHVHDQSQPDHTSKWTRS